MYIYRRLALCTNVNAEKQRTFCNACRTVSQASCGSAQICGYKNWVIWNSISSRGSPPYTYTYIHMWKYLHTFVHTYIIYWALALGSELVAKGNQYLPLYVPASSCAYTRLGANWPPPTTSRYKRQMAKRRGHPPWSNSAGGSSSHANVYVGIIGVQVGSLPVLAHARKFYATRISQLTMTTKLWFRFVQCISASLFVALYVGTTFAYVHMYVYRYIYGCVFFAIVAGGAVGHAHAVAQRRWSTEPSDHRSTRHGALCRFPFVASDSAWLRLGRVSIKNNEIVKFMFSIASNFFVNGAEKSM